VAETAAAVVVSADLAAAILVVADQAVVGNDYDFTDPYLITPIDYVKKSMQSYNIYEIAKKSVKSIL
jgi:hypothetical protein